MFDAPRQGKKKGVKPDPAEVLLQSTALNVRIALTQELHSPFAKMHSEFYWVFFEEARATNSSNFESKSFRMGDPFDFL